MRTHTHRSNMHADMDIHRPTCTLSLTRARSHMHTRTYARTHAHMRRSNRLSTKSTKLFCARVHTESLDPSVCFRRRLASLGTRNTTRTTSASKETQKAPRTSASLTSSTRCDGVHISLLSSLFHMFHLYSSSIHFRHLWSKPLQRWFSFKCVTSFTLYTRCK